MQNNEKATSAGRIPCGNCGSQMVYSAEKRSLLCEHCGHKQVIETGTDKIKEKSLESGLNLSSKERGLKIETKTFTCTSCGASTAVASDVVSFECGFCGSKVINPKATEEGRIISPEGIIPFTVSKKNALEIYKNWIGRGWFRPNDLAKMARMEKIHGVYIPFWTYDAETHSQWWADAGYYYYVTETYTDSEGNLQTREVRHIRWVPASGYVDMKFDDILVVASQGIKQYRAEKIFPFDLKKLVNYDPRFIAGWEAELYKIDLAQGAKIAEKIMDRAIYNRCVSEIPGDTYQNLNIITEKTNLTYKHILLPIWISSYRYNGKLYQVIVNGQTGAISGEKPLSWSKIILTIILVILFVIILSSLKN
ncbi:MAG: hypothetical protein NZ519_07065 [Bacteroidia bacterium]|nr:hypothetical protein [Bacteroidia bacterium]MDW8301332.1 hypothetical protein [Bacteroidia bacterium]